MWDQMSGWVGPMGMGPAMVGPRNFVVLSLGDYDQLRRNSVEKENEHAQQVRNAHHEGRIAMFCDGLLATATKRWSDKTVRVTPDANGYGFTLVIDNSAYRYSHNRTTNEITGPQIPTATMIQYVPIHLSINDIPRIVSDVSILRLPPPPRPPRAPSKQPRQPKSSKMAIK